MRQPGPRYLFSILNRTQALAGEEIQATSNRTCPAIGLNLQVHRVIWIVVCIALAGCSSIDTSKDPNTYTQVEEVLVTFRSDTNQPGRLAQALGIDYGLSIRADWPLESLGVPFYVFQVPKHHATKQRIKQLVQRIGADKRVESVQRLQYFDVLTDNYNDPQFALQAGIHTLKAATVHRWATGKGVSVGVVNTGIVSDHDELEDCPGYTENFVVDGTGDDVGEAHGTAIAGVIGALANNAKVIVGVAPYVELTGLRACWKPPGSRRGRCSSFTLAHALHFAIFQKLDILNLSLQGEADPLLERLADKAGSQEMAIIAAYEPLRLWATPAKEGGKSSLVLAIWIRVTHAWSDCSRSISTSLTPRPLTTGCSAAMCNVKKKPPSALASQ